MSFAFLLSMPGAPYIYYGDEIGMRYVEGLTSVEGGYNRTGSRSPMQWDDSKNAGFSDGPKESLYIPQDPDENRPTVAKQIKEEDSLLNEVKKLIEIRKAHKALMNSGEIRFICNGAMGEPLAYIRWADGETILVVVNPTDREFELDIKDVFCEGEFLYQIGEKPTFTEGKIVIKKMSAFYLVGV